MKLMMKVYCQIWQCHICSFNGQNVNEWNISQGPLHWCWQINTQNLAICHMHRIWYIAWIIKHLFIHYWTSITHCILLNLVKSGHSAIDSAITHVMYVPSKRRFWQLLFEPLLNIFHVGHPVIWIYLSRQHESTESECLNRNCYILGTPAQNLLSKGSNWSHYMCLLDGTYIVCAMALSITLYPDLAAPNLWLCIWLIPTIEAFIHSNPFIGHWDLDMMYSLYMMYFMYMWQCSLCRAQLGGVGHCFAWHVWVNFGFYFNFKTEELVHSGLCVMHLEHNSIFSSARIKILLWKINRCYTFGYWR